ERGDLQGALLERPPARGQPRAALRGRRSGSRRRPQSAGHRAADPALPSAPHPRPGRARPRHRDRGLAGAMSVITPLLREIEEGPDGPRTGAFFDFDGTLIAGYSATVFLRDSLLRREVGPEQILQAVLAGLEMRVRGADVTKLVELAAVHW